MFRTILNWVTALAILSQAGVALAQQPAQAQQQAPAASQALTQQENPTQAPAVPASAAPVAASASAAADAADADSAAKALKPSLHELSPWSMFLSADILVKIVMSGLAFASLMTWTIFIGKTIELSVIRRKLTAALGKIRGARSLAEAQFALGGSDVVLSQLLDAAMQEARLSAGIANDGGIKERAASSFAEISRAEARRIRLGMGLLASIGSTSPFVGLFGTVWGIMNSFIGISKAQTTNLAVVAPGIAEALLATAVGLAAAIPAVLIYNHFARVTKTYLELVARASGAAARLLSRDLDRGHRGVLARAAE
ncbi:tonB-system energizer ExbB [Bradyrhizobium sp. STM 3562]|uniref:tonB-system energizer ExbB n=1 Tax=Bradyrhizobium sp. STM 3562 TaxID=578924 RepID=UPI00388FD14C